jgi:hypothetical protein
MKWASRTEFPLDKSLNRSTHIWVMRWAESFKNIC